MTNELKLFATVLAAFIVLALIGGALTANYLKTIRYGGLMSRATCDERGVVAITFPDGASYTCIPREEMPATRPPQKFKPTTK